MNINEIDKLIQIKKQNPSIAQKYGVLSVVLGSDLHIRVKDYTEKKGIKMASLIKALLNSYLNEKENDV